MDMKWPVPKRTRGNGEEGQATGPKQCLSE